MSLSLRAACTCLRWLGCLTDGGGEEAGPRPSHLARVGTASAENSSDRGDGVVALRVKGVIGFRLVREWQLRRRCLLKSCVASSRCRTVTGVHGTAWESMPLRPDAQSCLVDTMVTHHVGQMLSTCLESSEALFESPIVKMGPRPASLSSFKEVPVAPKLQLWFPNVIPAFPSSLSPCPCEPQILATPSLSAPSVGYAVPILFA